MNLLERGQRGPGLEPARRIPRIGRTEHIVLAWLSLIAVACLTVAAVTKPTSQGWQEWTSGLALGLASAAIASLLTFLLIDLMLTRQREAETHKSHEQERLDSLLARLRAGEPEENRTILEELRTLGWLKNGALRGADLSGATLDGLDFGSADLQGAIFVGTSLRRASFRNANVSMVRFTRADLRGARFDAATADGTEFIMVTKDRDTVMP